MKIKSRSGRELKETIKERHNKKGGLV